MKRTKLFTKVIEYSLFIPGLFTNYFAHPYETARHFRSFETHIDFQNCRALVLEDGDNDLLTLTTTQDLARMVVKAVEYDGEWPVTGGIKGTEMSIRELIEIGEKVRGMRLLYASWSPDSYIYRSHRAGRPFAVELLRREDLEAGLTKASWLPVVDHPGMPNAAELASKLTASMILSISAGALNTTNEWNRIFPGYRFTSADDFLKGIWMDKR